MAMELEEELRASKSNEVTVSTSGKSMLSRSFLTESKAAMGEHAKDVVSFYTDGHNSPVEGLIIAKKMVEFAELIKENLADAAVNELKLSGSEKRTIAGNEINQQMVGVRYNFSSCKDPIWDELNIKIKEREAFLKTIKGSKQELIEETGEVVQIFEPTKSGKLSLIIKY